MIAVEGGVVQKQKTGNLENGGQQTEQNKAPLKETSDDSRLVA